MGSTEEHWQVWNSLKGLHNELDGIVKHHPDQFIGEGFMPTLTAILEEARSFVGTDAVVTSIEQQLASTDDRPSVGLRAIDALLMVRAMMDRVGQPTINVEFGRKW